MAIFNRIKLYIFVLTLVLSAAFVSGCDRNGNADDAQQEEAGDNAADGADNAAADTDAADAAPAANGGVDITRTDNPPAPAEPVPASDDTGQVAITRISPDAVTNITGTGISTATGELDPDVPNGLYVTGYGEYIEPDRDSDDDGTPDYLDHDPTPDLFMVEECQMEVNGIFKKELADDIIAEINKCRRKYGIEVVTRNTSLLAAADHRAKEQAYFIGHFRPDGTPFTSITKGGFVKGECIAVDYRDAEKMVEAWYAVNGSRMQLMNPSYSKIGVSVYDIDDTYYIAAEFGY